MEVDQPPAGDELPEPAADEHTPGKIYLRSMLETNFT